MNVTGEQFIQKLEETLDIPSGTIRETDRLDGLEGWDSIAVISVMAMIEYSYDVTVDPDAMAQCQTVGDLFRLVPGDSGKP